MTLAVLTTIYPAAEPYLADFAASLAAQDDDDFTLYVANDGVAHADRHFTGLGARTRVIPLSGHIAAIRQQAVRHIATEGHDQIVFADSDDRFATNRIAVSRAALRTHEVVVNELIPFGDVLASSGPWLQVLPIPAEPTWHTILDQNVFGLSNTAARTSVIVRHAGLVAADIQAFDWALFSRALFAGARALFTTGTVTHYRQHAAQLGLTKQRDADALRRMVGIKARHYADLAGLDHAYAERAHYFAHLGDNQSAFTRWSTIIASQPSAPGLWWSAARLLKESDHAAL